MLSSTMDGNRDRVEVVNIVQVGARLFFRNAP